MDVFFRFRHSSGRDKYARVRSHSMCIIKRAKETVITSKDYTRTYTKKVFLLCSTVSFFCRFYLHENLLTSLAALVGSVCVALSQLSVIISSFSAIQLKNSDLFCIFTHSVIRHSVAAVIKCDIANRYKHTFGRHHACYVCVCLCLVLHPRYSMCSFSNYKHLIEKATNEKDQEPQAHKYERVKNKNDTKKEPNEQTNKQTLCTPTIRKLAKRERAKMNGIFERNKWNAV